MKKYLLMMLVLAMVGCTTTQANINQTSVVSIHRSVPEHITDIGIERQSLAGLAHIQGLAQNNHRVAIDAFRGEVLLTGEVLSQAIGQNIETMVKSIREVKTVYNYLKATDTPKSQSHTVHENYLKTKLMGKLLTSGIKPTQYHLVVRDDIAYVMGVLTYAQVNVMEQMARQTGGVLGFRSLVTVLATEEEVQSGRYRVAQTGHENTPSTPTTQAPSEQTSQNRQQQVPTMVQPKTPYVQLYNGTNSP